MSTSKLNRREALGLLAAGGALSMTATTASAAAATAETAAPRRIQEAADWTEALARYISTSQTAAIPE
jgi:hypothetical protein